MRRPRLSPIPWDMTSAKVRAISVILTVLVSAAAGAGTAMLTHELVK